MQRFPGINGHPLRLLHAITPAKMESSQPACSDAALLAVTCTWVDARASDIGLANYYHSVWTIKDGAPAAITTMAQTRDGWLWLGTPSGLYRFDGIRFAKFASTDGSSLLSSNISNLYAPPDGSLIVGYMAGGLSVIAQDKVTTWPRAQQWAPCVKPSWTSMAACGRPR